MQRPTNRVSRQRERIEFRFSNFQALQVPKGWDRLLVSLISVETGKTIAKLGKALVKNGSCQWTESLSESIYISRDDSSRGYEECLIKLLVSSGSTRPNTLGELTINMCQYTSSKASSAVSQPLKKCSYGTILQAKVQRLRPRSKTRDEEPKNSKSHQNVDGLDTDNRSDNSSDSAGKPPREKLASTSPTLDLDSKEASVSSASGTIHSFNSLKGSRGREDSSIKNALKIEEYDSPERGHFSVYDDDDSLSNQPSVNTRMYSRGGFHTEAAVKRPSMSNIGSSRNLLDAAEDTIEELRAEAKMWERNARKLVIDLDLSRNDFSNLSKKHVELEMELSASRAEQDGLKREVEKVKLELENLIMNKANGEDAKIQSEKAVQIRKELENEIRYQQGLNDDLSQQLKRCQESNIELVSVLQELEETIEQQRIEIDDLSSINSEFTELQNSVARNSVENRTLLLQLEQVLESEKKLKDDIELLEEALRKRTDELENERTSNSHILRDYEYKMSVKEDEIANLEATLSGHVKGEHDNSEDLVREIELLREKVQELEKDCTELTDENLELLFKLKDSDKTDMRKCSSFDSVTSEHRTVCPSDESEVSDPKFQMSHLDEVQNSGFEHFDEILKEMDMAFHLLKKPWFGLSSDETETCHDFLLRMTISKISFDYVLSFLQEINKILEMRIGESTVCLKNHDIEIKDRDDVIADARKTIDDSILEIEELKKSKAKSEEKYENLMKELEAQVSNLQDEKSRLEKDMELALRDREISSECMGSLQNDLTALHCAVSSHISANTNLERELEVLESRRKELEDALSGLQEDNSELKRENQELHEKSSALVDQLNESKKSLSDFTKKIEFLEDHLTSVLDDFVLRENSLKSDIDALVKENSYQKEKLAQEDSLHQILLEKTTEFESLQEEVEHLHKERERISFDTSGEVSSLLADKAELQASLQLVQSEAELTKNKLDIAVQESELKIQDLKDQLADCEESQQRLMAEHERSLKLLANYKRREEKLKNKLNDLELKLTVSNYENEQLTKEMGILKGQLQNMSGLQDEISMLKSKLKGCRIDKGKLELALQTISGDYEELRAEKISLSETISTLESSMSEFEECKRIRLCLEENLLQMEKDLSEKEILCIQNADLKNELTEIKRANMQFHQKMYRLEEEKDECLKKAQALEENLKLMEERNNFHNEVAHNHDYHDQELSVSVDNVTKRQLLENESAEGLDANDNKNTSLQESRTSGGKRNNSTAGSKKSGVVTRERYERTKSSLETELRELKERYLEMSLKYAEVENQREDLVMKLKATRSGKKWFL